MTKSKEWSCDEGCDLSEGVICPHLEAMLTPMNKGMMFCVGDEAATNSSTDFFRETFPITSPDVMLERVRNYGILEEWDLALLEAYFYHNLSTYDIAKKLDYVCARTVQRRLKDIKRRLVEAGYSQELE